jgi:hypothetical protein
MSWMRIFTESVIVALDFQKRMSYYSIKDKAYEGNLENAS